MIITLPLLADGEIYAGLILNEDGTPSHHLVLLPGDSDDAAHTVQIEWAKIIGGTLPTPQEQALLYANCKQHFKQDWYWSAELCEPDSGSAWGQSFVGGYQHGFNLYSSLRARAVRRLPV